MTTGSRRWLAGAGLLLAAAGLSALATLPGGEQDPPAPARMPEVLAAGTAVWSGCDSWWTEGWFAGATAPGPRPAGWGPSTDGATGVTVQAFRCASFATDTLERGPLTLLLEWHTNAEAPPACLDGLERGGRVGVLSGLWVDDAAVAADLAQRHGLPAAWAGIDFTTVGPPAARVHRTQWSVGSGAASSVDVPEGPMAVNANSTTFLFWPTPEGLGRMVLDAQGQGTLTSPTTGSMQDPMLLARSNGGTHAGLGAWLPQVHAEAALRGYADTGCGGAA